MGLWLKGCPVCADIGWCNDHPKGSSLTDPTGDALKACPFCGGDAAIDDYSTSYRKDAKPLYGIACNNTDCPIEAAIISSDRVGTIAAWNTRTPTTEAGVSLEEVESFLLSLLHGEHSSLSISFNESNGPNYETVQSFDESTESHADWISDEERDRAYALNREWVAQWYPETPIGFCAVRASSLPALIAFLRAESKNEAPRD
jgi:hypothetical protein